ncbi:uncharacterized protein FIBRA_07133 [Fibroporia radiculosa]|uniref:Uncharacterized protein n=1 Tax=Fibroporia radiculosa TaxID=599839 RepID=J4IBM8_9APHY|nr:uncharacterized protein FIBRA_07133 [Fibroporia radiculosa]CCM04936.1 predicted protein [Fibroporia radiculosa]
MPQAHHHIHAGGPQYAPPVLRAASPTSSIGTEYGEDNTDLADRELNQQEFEQKCEVFLRLHEPRPEEELAREDPRLPKPKTAAEEKVLHESVMKSLRIRVKKLEEDDLFEQMMLRGTRVAQEQQASSNDIDSIMLSLMSRSTGVRQTAPWGGGMSTVGTLRSTGFGSGLHLAHQSIDSSNATAGKQG